MSKPTLEVGQEFQNGPLVHDWAAHALGHHQTVRFGMEISVHRSTDSGSSPIAWACITPLHGFQTSHPTILLESHPVREKILSWSFRRACQHGAHHNYRKIKCVQLANKSMLPLRFGFWILGNLARTSTIKRYNTLAKKWKQKSKGGTLRSL